ncbi:BolA family protein [Legionella brunensis]|uniref:Protein BolA n=1 Tax=Legionella brunensis TaxID=29422 RepID=A0A0W0SDS7_9GAMM|nr:BolA/IbaG family iron-sulfur metabolism protein [Legionella brunensis]KTC81626.1 Protein BolA [Legionella brunensis]
MKREERIAKLITTHLTTSHFLIENESNKHHVPEGSETHFKVLIVAEAFKEMTMLNRHRTINTLLADELKTGLHALSLHLYTSEEWERCQQKTQTSPACRDGYRHG